MEDSIKLLPGHVGQVCEGHRGAAFSKFFDHTGPDSWKEYLTPSALHLDQDGLPREPPVTIATLPFRDCDISSWRRRAIIEIGIKRYQ